MMEEIKKLIILVLIIGLYSGVVHAELVALWEFDFGTGNDSVGDNHGTLIGDPNWVTGRIGGAFQFDGVDDYVDCGSRVSLMADQITLAVWIKTVNTGNSTSYPYIMGRRHGLRHHQSNNIEFLISINGAWQRVQFPADSSFNNFWHHLAGTYDGEMLRLYIDGELKTTSECAGPMGGNNLSVNIGRNPTRTDRFFKGAIDDVCIFNHALTEGEVKQLYAQGGSSFISKDYMEKLVEEAEVKVKELKSQEAIAYLNEKIAEYEQWRAKNINYVGRRDSQISSDMYFLLARAKENAGISAKDVVEMYKQLVLRPRRPSNYVPAALLWLSEKIPTSEYTDVVKKCIRNSNEPSYYIYNIADFFESKGNWAAFKLILDGVFTDADDAVLYAKAVAKGLEKNEQWTRKFLEYCQSKPECTEYLFCGREKVALKNISQKDFKKAAEIYRDIVNQCGPYQEKAVYKLRLFECLFNDGQYDSVAKGLEKFIKDNKATHRILISKAFMLKGQAYVQLGNVDQAIDTFLTLLIEYPRTKQAQEANFFVGYCYMLQGKFRQATEAFNLLMKDYPESSYIAKAESYLTRIKNMTD